LTFIPPRCPYPECILHRTPEDGFFCRKGSYRPKCRPHPVPRFRCNGCLRTFSRQSFRMDYRDHRPDLNPRLAALLSSGLGLRQTARLLHLSPRCLELKFRKVARHLHLLHRSLRAHARLENPSFLLDEMETFETERSTGSLTIPVVIHERSMFVIAADCGPIPPSGTMTASRRARIQAKARANGRRPNRSRQVVRRVLARAACLCQGTPQVYLGTDQKKTYPRLAREAFGKERLVLQQHSSKLPRTSRNPLFRINLTNAILRDLNGRLRRRSWLVSKKRYFLRLQLALATCYRNYQRKRFNRDHRTPGMVLGIVKEPLSWEQMLSDRQDWGRRNIDVRATA